MLAAFFAASAESGTSWADSGLVGLDEQDTVRTAYTRVCLADESCTRELFLDVTLGNRFDAKSFYPGFVLKWSGPVSLYTAFADDRTRKIADEAAEWIVREANAAGLSLKNASARREPLDPEAVGRRIFIIGSKVADGEFPPGEDAGDSGDGLFQALLAEARAAAPNDACTMALRGDTTSREIFGALVLVKPSWDGEAIRACIALRLLQCLGLVSDLGVPGFDSLMSGDVASLSPQRAPTGAMDRMMLSLLYDPSIEFGMTKEQVLKVFPEVYARHKPSGPIATQAVPTELIDPVDNTTLECMATPWCAEEMFLQMAVTGSDIEPIPTDQQVIKKKILPATVVLVKGTTVGEAQWQAAQRGLNAATRLAGRIGLQFLRLEGEHALPSHSNMVVLVTGDLDADKPSDFAPWLEGDVRARIFADLENLYRPDHCRGIFRRYGNGLGIWLDIALLPGAADVTPSLVERCVIEEFLQGFGLAADLRTGLQTLFDDLPDNQKPTGFDLFMLALLDHPAIMPGMTGAEVSAVFGQVHADVWSVFKADTWWLKGADIDRLPDDL